MGTETPEKLGDLSKVTQLSSGRVAAKTKTWSKDSFYYSYVAFKNKRWWGQWLWENISASLSL